nr:exosortase-associated protein EpsI, V-type [Novosphingobium sp. Gsoil 351]
MLAASGLALARMPSAQAAPIAKDRFDSWVPDIVGPWSFASVSGVVLPPPDALSDRLYDNIIARVYEAAELPAIMLMIAYNNIQDGVLQVHRPEICYPVGGYELSPTRQYELSLGNRALPANVFTASGPNRIEQILYWTRLGDAFPRTWIEQRLAVARANVAGRIPDGVLVRLSLLGNDPGGAMPLLERFTRSFLDASPPPLRRILIG